MTVSLLLTLVEFKPGESASRSHPSLEYSFVGAENLAERRVKTLWQLSPTLSQTFPTMQ